MSSSYQQGRNYQPPSSGYPIPKPNYPYQPYPPANQPPYSAASLPYRHCNVYAPSVFPDPNFNARRDCEALKKAMEGLGTNEDELIRVLCRRSWQQRSEIERTYKQLYGKDLEKEVDSETSGDFWRVLERLLKTPVELAAYELHDAIEGSGTDEDTLVDIICTRTNQELLEVQQKYREMYGNTLEADVIGDTSGNFGRLLTTLLKGQRPPDSQQVDTAAASADARALYEGIEKRSSPDQERTVGMLTSRSFSQLRAIFDEYARQYKKEISDVIRAKFGEDLREGLLAIVGMTRNRPAYFASRVNQALTGAGTKDKMLLRLIVSRCDVDLGAIKFDFLHMYDKPLSKTVQDKTFGDYKNALLALIGD